MNIKHVLTIFASIILLSSILFSYSIVNHIQIHAQKADQIILNQNRLLGI